MKKPSLPSKTNAAVGGGRRDSEDTWYFVRLAFLAIPWNSRNRCRAKGTLFKQYYLLRAPSIESAFRKAEHILSVSENRKGEGTLNGERVSYRKVGIMDLEPLYQKLESGVELFDESEKNVPLARANRDVVSARQRSRIIAYERRKGKPRLFDVYWGEDFDRT